MMTVFVPFIERGIKYKELARLKIEFTSGECRLP